MGNYDKSAKEGVKMTIEFIKERMEHLEISAYRLAKDTGISEAQLSRWFNHKSDMGITNYYKVLGALQLRPYLIPAEDDENRIVHMPFN